MPSRKQPLNIALKVAIAATGRKQRAIAKQARVKEDALSAILHGHRPGTPEERARIARAVAKTVEEVFE